MENLLNSIMSQFDDNSLQVICSKANASPTQAKSALASAVPILMNALAKNSSSQEGASSLQQAVSRDHDGSLIDNLGGFLNNPASANGAGILKHILGNKQQYVAKYISNDAGISGESAGKILEIAAPIVMAFLGKKNAQGSEGSISSLLNSFLDTEKSESPKSQNVIRQLLDSDNDGNVMDDITELGMSFLGRIMKK